MHTITTWAELARYLQEPIHPDLRGLLETRRDQLAEYGDLSELGTFNFVQPGDTLEAIETALRFPLIMDGAPTWEWVERHGPFFEAPIILSDDGFGHVLIVQDTESTDPTLLALCREHA